LYTLVVELKDAQLNTLDAVVHNFGIRTMTFDPNLGFFLNGQSTPLRGVDMHQDYYHKAWAIDPRTLTSRSPYRRDRCDTLRLATTRTRSTPTITPMRWASWSGPGAVRQQQHGLRGRQHRFACPGDPEATGFANVRQQLQELIRQQYNPSIGHGHRQ
jgi:hypothetical protein